MAPFNPPQVELLSPSTPAKAPSAKRFEQKPQISRRFHTKDDMAEIRPNILDMRSIMSS